MAFISDEEIKEKFKLDEYIDFDVFNDIKDFGIKLSIKLIH